uniref:WD repeat-containing protein 55 homolog n=1 Tax=Strigamia maritima TaxID=126957 RepID=T1J5W5_STRMM
MDSEMVSNGNQELVSSDCKIKWIQVLQVSFAMHNFSPACDGKYLVIPCQHRGALGLWNLDNLSQDPLILYGHAWSITALSLSIGTIPKLLCSCAEDWVILWNFGSSSEEPECGLTKLLPKSQAQIRSPGQVHFACFVFNDRILVLLVDREIYLYRNIAHIATFEGHLAKVTAIWDTYKLSLLHKSNILTGSPIVNLACDILSPQFVMGSMDGHIWIHDLSPGSQYRELASLDVAKSTGACCNNTSNHAESNGYHAYESTNFVFGKSRIPHDKLLPPDATFRQENDSQVEPGWAILGFHFQKPLNGHLNISDTSIHPWHEGNFSAIMSPAPTLLIGMTTAIVSLNLRTLEIDLIANLQNEKDTFIQGSSEIVGLAGTVSFCPCVSAENKVWCVIKSLFTSAVYIGVIDIPSEPTQDNIPAFSPLEMKMARMTLEENKSSIASSRDGEPVKLSLIACEPLHQASPLRSTFTRLDKRVIVKKSSKELISKLSRTKSKESKVNLLHSCHTHSRIKSPGHSGWSTARCPKSTPPSSTSIKPKSTTKLITKLAEGYATYNDPPSHLSQTIRIMNQTASITSIDYSGNGKTLACATSLNSAHIIKSNGKILNLAGHNATVNCISYNLDGSCILTASDDKTAKLWSWKNHSMVMDIQAILKSQPVLKNISEVHSVKEPLFTKEIKHAQFFYMDKFILLTSGNSLYLYKYNLEPSKSNLTKFRFRGRYKLVKEFPVSAQQILHTAAINQFYSYLVLCACSDRSVRIFDMNVGSVVQQVFDVHTKPPYKICLNSGSAFAAQHPSAYNMFLTTAVGDNIKLWDLRSNRCVQRFIGNMNRAFHCGLRFSPCARYFACGSEDKSAYIFDLRGGAYVNKLTGHSDVVTDVVYKPDEPTLVTATNDGVVSYFAS